MAVACPTSPSTPPTTWARPHALSQRRHGLGLRQPAVLPARAAARYEPARAVVSGNGSDRRWRTRPRRRVGSPVTAARRYCGTDSRRPAHTLIVSLRRGVADLPDRFARRTLDRAPRLRGYRLRPAGQTARGVHRACNAALHLIAVVHSRARRVPDGTTPSRRKRHSGRNGPSADLSTPGQPHRGDKALPNSKAKRLTFENIFRGELRQECNCCKDRLGREI